MRTSKIPVGLLVAVVVLAGVVGLLSSHTSAQQTRTIHLAQGWSLVAWTGETQSAPAALADLGDAVSVVYGYNNDSQTFTRCIVGRPEVSTLTHFEPAKAYWVMALRSADWSVAGQSQPSCPTVTPCPSCPSASDSWSDLCASTALMIEFYEVELDIAETVGVVGTTPSEIQAALQQTEQVFDQQCQGVALAEPSLLAMGCATAAKWKGSEETANLYDPDPQRTVWINQLDDIVDDYCMPEY